MGSKEIYYTTCVNDDTITSFRYAQGWQDPSVTKKPPAKVARIVSQDYNEIKRQCLEKGTLWEDPNFPADQSSLFPTQHQQVSFQWKRPGDLCKDPRMFVDGFGRFDVAQGDLGNCWVLAATASLCCTKNYKMFHQIIPKDNLFVKDYAGVFHFRIWQYGKWIDVAVDDRLPTWNGRLVFVHSPTHNEFWPALLEKAYAKVNGSYEALQGGSVGEAMEDFTGGVVETSHLRKAIPENLFMIMKQSFDRDSLLGCSIDPQVVGGTIEGKLPNGLITGHAYSITGLRKFKIKGDEVNLVRVRNPWGNEEEWKGSWSDRSPEWKQIDGELKKNLDLSFEDDGEFWMSYKDFIANFTTVDICMAAPIHDVASEDSRSRVKRHWEVTSYEGTWRKNINAGGCRNHLDTFASNPQYRIEVIDPDVLDEDDTGTIVVALMQKERRKKSVEGEQMLTIGYYLYKVPPEQSGVLDVNFFKYNMSTSKSPSFSNVREMVGRHKVKPGSYVIVPTTFVPNQDGDFLLRIFSEKGTRISEVDEEPNYIEKPHEKVKPDLPVYGEMDAPGTQEIKGSIPAESEIKRTKTMLLTVADYSEEKDLKALFKEISGEDMEVDAYELRDILDSKFKPEFKFQGFNLETSRSMVAMMDIDHSGRLGYEEFKKLWKDIRLWKKVFIQYDMSGVSSLDTFELRSALTSSGFLISNQTFRCLAMRYGDKNGLLYFDDFVHCSVRLKTMFAIYDEIFRTCKGPMMMTLDQFIQMTMYS